MNSPSQVFGAIGLIVGLLTSGCRDSQPREEGQAPPAIEASNSTGSLPSPSANATASPVSPGSTKGIPASFYPITLDDFYQRQFVDYRPTDSWAQVPRGEVTFEGVPFLMFGKIDLTGLGRARDGEFQPPGTGEIPVGRHASRVHLIHGASYDSPEDTPIACLRLRYANSEIRRLFIRYGAHVRNWYIERTEVDSSLSDPRSTVIWNGTSRGNGEGTPTRLFKTTFENPLPGEEVRTAELLSLFARANPVFLAITFEDTPGPHAPSATEDPEESSLRQEDTVKILDADTQQPIQSAAIRLFVTQGARRFGFGSYVSDSRGEFRITYPPGVFRSFALEVKATGYLPTNLEISNEDGLLGSNLPVHLKRETAP